MRSNGGGVFDIWIRVLTGLSISSPIENEVSTRGSELVREHNEP